MCSLQIPPTFSSRAPACLHPFCSRCTSFMQEALMMLSEWSPACEVNMCQEEWKRSSPEKMSLPCRLECVASMPGRKRHKRH